MRLYHAFLLAMFVSWVAPPCVQSQDAAVDERNSVADNVAGDASEETPATDGEASSKPGSETETDERLSKLVEQAARERKNREYEEAIKLLDQVLAQSAGHAKVTKDALYARALSYLAVYRYPEATADVERAIEIDPQTRDYAYTRGVIARDTGNLDEALTWFGKALGGNRFHSEALRARIKVYRERGNYDAMLQDCEWLRKHEPTAREMIYRAQALLGLGRLDEALERCTKVLVAGKEGDREGWHYVTRADVHLALGKPKEAYYDLAYATAKYFPTREALVKLAEFFMEIEPDLHEAIAYWTALIEVKRFHEPETVPEDKRHEPAVARLRRGQAYMRLDKKRFAKNALADFTRYIVLEPGDATGYAERARVHILLRRDAEAEADLVKALQLDEGNEEYTKELEQLRRGASGAAPEESGAHTPSGNGGEGQ
ncbi:MAG: tetratricopeptide repeat protein [Verrucomicrobia bacterium]|nr:tetratricopeptide repeat protein [Verrucomicrobiota bacterium]